MSGRAVNILLVEDNLDHAELLRRNLEQFPAASFLHHVEDGEAAIDYIFGHGVYADRARFPAPDLVLLDLRLPRVDGLEVLRQVKRHPALRHTPVVVLTTSDAEHDAAKAYEHHASSFLTKPVDARRFLQLFTELGFSRPDTEKGDEWQVANDEKGGRAQIVSPVTRHPSPRGQNGGREP
jgi:CheY-like chemotaxis protein